MDQPLTIGALAERCGLSRSALRFYDQCGLLRPAAVDEATGYRYYDEAQVEMADLVRRLRGAEVPVQDVKAFLAAGADERRQFLASYRAGLEARLVSAFSVLDELERSMTTNQNAQTPGCAISAQALSAALGQVLFAVSRDERRPELAGVLVECKDSSLRLVATDSYRLAIRDIVPDEVADDVAVRAFIAAADAGALQVRLAAGGRCALRQGADGGLEVQLGDQVLALVALAGEFPDYESTLLGLPTGHTCLVLRSALIDAFCRAEGSLVTLRFAPRELRIDMGDEITAVGSDWDGPDFDVLLNAGFVSEALAPHVGPDIAIEVAGPLQPVTFRSADDGTLSVLVMPVRPRDHATAPEATVAAASRAGSTERGCA
jgi:DNA polymerase-3 subunit beta